MVSPVFRGLVLTMTQSAVRKLENTNVIGSDDLVPGLPIKVPISYLSSLLPVVDINHIIFKSILPAPEVLCTLNICIQNKVNFIKQLLHM